MSKNPNATWVKEALSQAVRRQQPDTCKLLFHSDQGVQYSAKLFVDYLSLMHITQSIMSRRGNCWDNSVMERFFRRLKSERLNHLSFINHGTATHLQKMVQRWLNFTPIKLDHYNNKLVCLN